MRKLSDVLRRICALALCLCMMAQYMPMAGFAEENTEVVTQAVEETTEPTEATTEPMEATTAPTEATTEPTEETTVPTEETTEPAEATEAETAGKVITAWTWVEPEEEEDRILDPETGEVYLSTTQEDPIPMELLTAALPAAILARVEDAEETVTLGPWTCEDYPAEGAFAGEYTFVTTLPEGYTLAEGVAALEVMVRFAEPEMLYSSTVTDEATLKYALNNYTSVTLAANITIKERITINKNMTLDLGGYTLTYGGGGSGYDPYGVFTLKSGNFTVKNGTLKGQQQNKLRCFNVTGGTLTIEEVTIQDFSCQGGGAISIDSGTCIMNSGTISGNSAWDKGGGVYVRGIFKMNGGTISGNNVSSGSGGGVYVYNSGTFTMTGGTISQNQAQSGGGVYVDRNGTFTMNGGEIRNNKAEFEVCGEGGGVKVYSGTFTMTGGTISGNTAKENGGGVYVDKNSFTMNGGTITNNTANAAGGGVYMYSGSFTMSGGSITGNQAGGDGKGVNIGGNVSCHLSGGAKITGNTGNGTGNLYINIGGTAERSITGLTAGAQLDIYFSREADAKVATGDKQSLNYLTCENEGYVFTLENSNELWVKLNRMEINTPPTGKEGLIYNGQRQSLVESDTAGTGGTMLYAVTLSGSGQPEKRAFSPNLPSKADAGKYTVWYYVPSDGDKADSDVGKLEVTIAQKTLGVNWTETILTYSGRPQQPTAELVDRVPYDGVYLEISNKKTDVGSYTTGALTLSGGRSGNYVLADDVQGTEFTILPVPLTITAKPKTITYGDAPDNDGVTYKGLVWTDDERCLKGKLEYTYTYEQYGDVGIYTITPEGLTSKNYEITFVDGPLYVDQKPISINWGETTHIYDGNPWGPTPTAGGMVNGDALTLTVSGEGTDVGSYTATVTGIQGDKAENYKLPDNPTTSYTITPADAQFTPPTAKEGLTYTGQAQELIDPGSSAHGTFQYWLDGEQPGETIPQAKDAGTYTVHYQLMGDKNHENGTAGQFDVKIAPKDIKGATIILQQGLRPYTGQEQANGVYSVEIGGLTLDQDDYTVSGREYATNAGTYTLTVTAKENSNFTGSASATWQIQKATDNEWTTPPTVTDWTYGEAPNVTMGVAKYGNVKVNYTTKDGNTSFGETVPTNAGSYKAAFTVAETGNYNGLETMVDFTIAPKDITGASITLEKGLQTYTGQELTNAVTSVTIDGLTLGKDDYTVSGNEKATDVGTYILTVHGRGNFTGFAPEGWEIQAADNTWLEEPSVTNWTYGDAPTVHAGTPRFGTVTVEYFTQDCEALGSTVPTDAGDYQVYISADANGNCYPLDKTLNFTISKKPLTVTANPKTVTYGDEPANDGVIYDGFVNGEDEKALKGTLDFDYDYKQYDKVGSYTITPKGLTSGNYDITFTKGILTVEQKDVTIQDVAVEASKVYDGTAVAAITHNGRLSANFDGENLTFQVGTAAYDNKNAGEDKTVTFTGFSLEGSAAENYQLTGQPEDTTASITPMPVELTVTAKDKTYDGTLTAELGTVTHSGFVAGDDVQLVNGTPSFVSKDKGENIQVTFTPFTLTGPDAGNYALIQPTGVKARISPRPVTVSGITAQNKTYDGNTQVIFGYADVKLEGNVDGDKLTVTAEGSFEDANVGDKLVNITGLTLGGAEQGNYVLAELGQQTGTTAAITANDRYLDLSGVDLGGDAGTVWIDGEKQPINTSGGSHILLSEEAGLLTTYTYSQGSGGNGYPTGMKVYRFRRADTGVTLEEVTEFENLLNYAGCSIRLTGTKGIRMITGISEAKRTALTGAQGLAGYTLEEYGTVVMRGVGTPTLENSNSHNFAYKKGKADPVFARAGGMIQYTNVLVGFSLEDCKDTLTLRPYVLLKDTATGETVTLYGGCVSRSIGYIAKQNENTYQPGSTGYQYIHEIIDAVYGTTEQGGETK